MKKTVILKSNLSESEIKQRLSEGNDLARSLGLKIYCRFPRFTIGLLDWGSNTLINQRIVKFSAKITSDGSGTKIVGYYRYSYFITLFLILFFGVSVYFMSVNSGRDYPFAPVLTALIGVVLISIFIFTEPWYPFISYEKGTIMGLLKTLFDIKA